MRFLREVPDECHTHARPCPVGPRRETPLFPRLPAPRHTALSDRASAFAPTQLGATSSLSSALQRALQLAK